MRKQSILERLEEIKKEIICEKGFSYNLYSLSAIAKEAGLEPYVLYCIVHSCKSGRDIDLNTIEKLAAGLNKIPVVFYKKSDEKAEKIIEKTEIAEALKYPPYVKVVDSESEDYEVEDLGVESFLNGKKIDNYVGKVFRKHRLLKGLSKREIAKRVGVEPITYNKWELGETKPRISHLEKASSELELVPMYLVNKLEYNYKPLNPFEEAIKIINEYHISSITSPESLDLGELKKILLYGEEIEKKINALKILYEINRKKYYEFES